MPYSVAYDEGDGMVCVTVSGLVVHDDQVASFYEAMRICQKKGCSRILVNLTGLNTALVHASECLQFGRHIAAETANAHRHCDAGEFQVESGR